MTKKSKRPFDRINFTLADIEPITEAQGKAFMAKEHLVLHGVAGSGKTFLALFLALRSLMEGDHKEVILIRSAVPTRDIGFLPGSEQEKARVYEVAYSQICSELFNRGDAYQNLKEKKLLQFMTTSYIRAITLTDCVIVVDECQNMTFHELDSIITRVGENCRVIFSGDFLQSDLNKNPKDKSGLKDFLKVLKEIPSFTMIDFGLDDIVRSALVKDYLVAKHQIL